MKLRRQVSAFITPSVLNYLHSCVQVRWRRSTAGDVVRHHQQAHAAAAGAHHHHQQQQHHQPTRSSEKIAFIFREPFVLTGYRVANEDWWYYVRSMFHAHNETFNIWSHCIGFFIFIYKLYWWLSHVESNEPLLWPLLGFALGTLAYSSLSTVAHMFHSKSELAHYTFFQLDYIGIGLNATGSALLTFYFCGGESFYKLLGYRGHVIYEVGNFVFGFLVCVSCGVAKLYYLRPYSFAQMFLKMGVCGIHIIYGFMPLFFLFYDRLFTDAGSDVHGDVTGHGYYVITFFIAVFFYASHMPERLCPGRFDLFGYGHGLFHIVMVVTSILQYDASWLELQSRRRQFFPSAPDAASAISQHAPAAGDPRQQFPQPFCVLLICEFVFLITACVIFVIITHRVRQERVQKILVSARCKMVTPSAAIKNHKTTTFGGLAIDLTYSSSVIKQE